MFTFLTWSGPRSASIASSLGKFLTGLFPEIKTWMSPESLKGEDWGREIHEQLDRADLGIACVVEENIRSEWLHYEVGYLRGRNRTTITFLLDLRPDDLRESPLQYLQHTVFDRDDVKRLCGQINNVLKKRGESHHSDANLNVLFDKHWPELTTSLAEIKKRAPHFTDRDLLFETLVRVQQIQRSIFGVFNRKDTVMMRGNDDYPAPMMPTMEEIVKAVKDPTSYKPPPPLSSPARRR